jgi:hypothetical protein
MVYNHLALPIDFRLASHMPVINCRQPRKSDTMVSHVQSRTPLTGFSDRMMLNPQTTSESQRPMTDCPYTEQVVRSS